MTAVIKLGEDPRGDEPQNLMNSNFNVNFMNSNFNELQTWGGGIPRGDLPHPARSADNEAGDPPGGGSPGAQSARSADNYEKLNLPIRFGLNFR